MTWTYRIIRDENGGHRIAEVYTNLPHVDGGTSWTTDPIAPYGNDADELKRDFDRMRAAFGNPVLDEATLRETIKNETG